MFDEDTIVIGSLHRIAFDRRPPVSRRVRQATGECVDPQPFHQRVRLNWDHLPVVQEHDQEKEKP